MLQNAFKRTPLQHFNQDTEQQRLTAKEQKIKDQQQQQQAADSAKSDAAAPNAKAESAPSADAASQQHQPPPPPGQVVMSPAQIDALQAEIALFQRNLTDAGMVLQL